MRKLKILLPRSPGPVAPGWQRCSRLLPGTNCPARGRGVPTCPFTCSGDRDVTFWWPGHTTAPGQPRAGMGSQGKTPWGARGSGSERPGLATCAAGDRDVWLGTEWPPLAQERVLAPSHSGESGTEARSPLEGSQNRCPPGPAAQPDPGARGGWWGDAAFIYWRARASPATATNFYLKVQ